MKQFIIFLILSIVVGEFEHLTFEKKINQTTNSIQQKYVS
jgi:hypothetical protein